MNVMFYVGVPDSVKPADSDNSSATTSVKGAKK